MDLTNNSSAIFEIIVVIIIFYTIVVYLILKYNRKGLQKSWKDNRCNPMYMPLAGVFDEQKLGFSGAIKNNFMNCYWNTTKGYFKILLKPFIYLLSILKNIVKNLYKTIDKLRNQLNQMRNFFLRIAIGVMDKMTNLMSAFIFKFHKIRDTIKRFFAIYKTMLYMIKSISLFFKSAKDGPIGDAANFTMKWAPTMTSFVVGPLSNQYPALQCPNSNSCCFTEDTCISIQPYNGIKFKKISDLKLGDVLKNGSRVTSKMIFRNTELLYKIDDGYVTGSHLINKNNKWQKVNNVLTYDENRNDEYVYCINTSDNIIHTKNDIFRDYNEISLNDDIIIRKLIYRSLNSFCDCDVNIPKYMQGFSKDLLFKYLNINSNSNLKDVIQTRGINSVIQIDASNIDLYHYNGYIFSGATLVFYNNRWEYICNIDKSTRVYDKIKYLYNITTYDSNIYFGDILIKDYDYTKNPYINILSDFITDYILNN